MIWNDICLTSDRGGQDNECHLILAVCEKSPVVSSPCGGDVMIDVGLHPGVTVHPGDVAHMHRGPGNSLACLAIPDLQTRPDVSLQ